MGIKQLRSRESKTRDGDLEIEIQREHTGCRSVSLRLLSPSLAKASETNLRLCRDNPSYKHNAQNTLLNKYRIIPRREKSFLKKKKNPQFFPPLSLLDFAARDTQEALLASHSWVSIFFNVALTFMDVRLQQWMSRGIRPYKPEQLTCFPLNARSPFSYNNPLIVSRINDILQASQLSVGISH